MILVLSLAILFLLIFIAYQNTKQAEFTRITLPINDIGEAGLRILHLSDMHMENLSISPEQLNEQLKDEPIDLIALTGDYLDRVKSIEKLRPYLEVLKNMNALYGIYVVFGNHDYVLKPKNFEKLQRLFLELGCHVLINESKTIQVKDQVINLIGIDDHSTKRSDLQKAYADIKDGINIVLTHDPNIVLKMTDYHFDYLLCGHFHGGQIHYPKAFHLVKMGKLPRMNMIKGLHFIEDKAFYISEGLGQTGFNIRLRSKPEITLHTLIAKEQSFQ
ncbi:metallophosphoesterase [Ammoniphilus resinae]|uniref:MPP superfamily phosphohydrolase n=1 Tax=Ammoniphilus resinae TaxID=861532 RepID=A0ABS4GRG1_9BACL|nr:metallophosphoesterase [Ammoniphilus resinae]MBP1932851.1 putative MPP superfamily phosphohydrolase [Ammoniphilus resinae]